MTEPAARVTSVRRTITVATALVAGQAVLCAVIGWVTFGGGDSARSTTRAAEPNLGPAVVVPPAAVVPVLPTPSRPRSKPPGRPLPAPPTSPPAPEKIGFSTPSRSSSSPAPAATSSTAAPPARPSPHPHSSGVLIPSPSASPVQLNVEVGKTCAPENAAGRTVAAIAVRCLSTKTGDLVWQII